MKYFKRYLPYILVIILFAMAFSVWFFIFKNPERGEYLKVAFLDVGQGDAIYIEAPNGRQMLVDGGSDIRIMPELLKMMPLADKSIDIVVATNPDLDHIGGLVEILEDYKIEKIIEPGIGNDTSIYQRLEKEVEENKIKKIIAERGTKIILDESRNIYFEILFPDRDVTGWDSNDASVVGKLVYNNISFLLMGDATRYTENLIRWNEKPEDLDINVLKLGHHGSNTSTSEFWLELTSPEVSIISVRG